LIFCGLLSERLRLFPFGGAFGEGDVAIEGEVGEAFGDAAGLGPLYFDPVEFGVLADSKDYPGIVGGEEAAAAYYGAMTFEVGGLIGDAGAYSVGVAFFAD
jgi:hypothetical protein